MARATTKPAANSKVTAGKKTVPGIRLTDNSKLVGVLFNTDMVTVLGFVSQTVDGGMVIDTIESFSKKVRITDYVDAYGRCMPRKLREFQGRAGDSLFYSRALRSDAKTQAKLDPKTVTADKLNSLLSTGYFTVLPDYAIVSSLIRRASTQADANVGKSVNGEGLIGLQVILHYPEKEKKKRVRDAAGNVKVVTYTDKEKTVRAFLRSYDAYSLPFEVKKYAVKRTQVKSALGSTTAMHNYYVSIKKDGLELADDKSKAGAAFASRLASLPYLDEEAVDKGCFLLEKEIPKTYNPGADPEMVTVLYSAQSDIDDLRNNGVFIKGAGAPTPFSAVKGAYTAADLFDMDGDEEEVETVETVVEDTSDDVIDDTSVGEMPSDDDEDSSYDDSSDEVAFEMADLSDDGDIAGLFGGAVFVGAPTVEGDGNLSSPVGMGVTLPKELVTPGIVKGVNEGKVIAEAYKRWDALCAKLDAVAKALEDGTPYTYGGGAEQDFKLPPFMAGKTDLVTEDVERRKVSIEFGKSKANAIGLNSINLNITRHFVCNPMSGIGGMPIKTNLDHKTLTVYAFDGKDAGAKGFSITLPTGETVTSTTVYEELKEISELMHSVDDGVLRQMLAITMKNAGLASEWKNVISTARKDAGINSASVAREKTMLAVIENTIATTFPNLDDAQKAEFIKTIREMCCSSGVTDFTSEKIIIDPITSEYRGGKHATASEYQTATTVASAVKYLQLVAQGNPPSRKPSGLTAQMIDACKAQNASSDADYFRISAEVAAKAAVDDIRNNKYKDAEGMPTDPDFWKEYTEVKAMAIEASAQKQINNPAATGGKYSLEINANLNPADTAHMGEAGKLCAEDSPVLVGAQEKLNSEIKAMVLWLLGTVGVGNSTNDGLVFEGGDASMPGLWKDVSKASTKQTASRKRTFEYAAAEGSVFRAGLTQPTNRNGGQTAGQSAGTTP